MRGSGSDDPVNSGIFKVEGDDVLADEGTRPTVAVHEVGRHGERG